MKVREVYVYGTVVVCDGGVRDKTTQSSTKCNERSRPKTCEDSHRIKMRQIRAMIPCHNSFQVLPP